MTRGAPPAAGNADSTTSGAAATCLGLRDAVRTVRRFDSADARPATIAFEPSSQRNGYASLAKEVAATLNIAVPTVETHRRQIMAKLDVWTIAELTKYAICEGLTSAGD